MDIQVDALARVAKTGESSLGSRRDPIQKRMRDDMNAGPCIQNETALDAVCDQHIDKDQSSFAYSERMRDPSIIRSRAAAGECYCGENQDAYKVGERTHFKNSSHKKAQKAQKCFCGMICGRICCYRFIAAIVTTVPSAATLLTLGSHSRLLSPGV